MAGRDWGRRSIQTGGAKRKETKGASELRGYKRRYKRNIIVNVATLSGKRKGEEE